MRNQPIDKNCLNCKRKFKAFICHIKNGGAKYCSKQCADLYKKGKPIAWTRTHGMRKHRLYSIWRSIKYRTENKKCSSYPRYGGRGIKNLWSSFEDFRDDMFSAFTEHEKKYGKKDTQIDRIDYNGHYCEENCRWVTIKEQAINKGNIKMYEINGENKPLSEWCNIFNVDLRKVWNRIYRDKWPTLKALTT